jgi:hypothetical protein
MRAKLLLILAACVTSIGLAACEALQTHEATAQIVVQYATAKYVENSSLAKRAERKAEVIRIATDLRDAAGGEGVSLVFLRERLAAELQRRGLSGADLVAINGLVNLVSTEIEKRITDGVLDPGEVVQVREVLQWVIDAAGLVLVEQIERA